MARIKAKNTTVRYNREWVYNPARTNSSLVELPALARSYTTQAEPIVDAANPELRAYGNASGTVTLSVVHDYTSEDEAFEETLRLAAFYDANPTGELLMQVGGASIMWQAGVESVELRPELMPGSVRLTVTVSFVLGAKKE